MTSIESRVPASPCSTQHDVGYSRGPVRVASESSILPVQATAKDKGRELALANNDDGGKKACIGSAKGMLKANAVVHRRGDDECARGDSGTQSTPTPLLTTLIVDNYDSFTYSIFQYFASVNGVPPLVVKNDDFPSWEALKKVLPNVDSIVISPGPGHPANADDFGISSSALQEASLPTLGICLGHQGFAHVYGGNVIRAPEPVHGRKSIVDFIHDYSLFHGIEQGTTVLRYHSLVVDKATLPGCLEVTCWTRDEQRLIMGLRHIQLPLHSIQFHPESVGTADGFRMLENFRKISLAWWGKQGKHAVGNRRVKDTSDALSIKLCRENRIAARAVEAGATADSGAAKDYDAGALGKAIEIREEKWKVEEEAREAARQDVPTTTAEPRGESTRVEAEDAEETNSVREGVTGWVVNVAVVPRRQEKGNDECEKKKQQQQMDIDDSDRSSNSTQEQQQQMGVEGTDRSSSSSSSRQQQRQMDVEDSGRSSSNNPTYDQAAIFERLFAKENVCFWLDSSSADERCAGVHARKRYSRRGCFSYMGGCSGPFAEAVEYYEKEKKAVIRGCFTPGGQSTETTAAVTTLQQADLFQLLATRMQCFPLAAGRDRSSTASRNTTTSPGKNDSPNSGSSNTSSTSNTDSNSRAGCSNFIKLRWWEMRDGVLTAAHARATEGTGQHAGNSKKPFVSSHAFAPTDFLGGYVGFFGYELRHLMESYEGVSTPVLAAATTAPSRAAAERQNSRSKNARGAAAGAAEAAVGAASCLQGGNHVCEVRDCGGDAEGGSRKRVTCAVQQIDTPDRGEICECKQERATAAGRVEAANEDVKIPEQSEKAAAETEVNKCVVEEAEEEMLHVHDPLQQQKTQEKEEENARRSTERQACDAVWLFADRVVAFDLMNNVAYLLWLTLPTEAAPLLLPAAAVEKEGDMQSQEGCKSCSCDQQGDEEQQQSSASTSCGGPLILVSAAAHTGEEVSTLYSPASPASAATTSSLLSSHLASPDGSSYSSPRVSASTTTGGSSSLAISFIDQATAEKAEGSRKQLLPNISATRSSSNNEERYTHRTIESIQLAWATQTLQQLLSLDSKDACTASDAAAAAATPTLTINTEREEKNHTARQTAVKRSNDNDREKDREKDKEKERENDGERGDEGTEAVTVKRKATERNETSNDDVIAKTAAATVVSGRSEGSEGGYDSLKKQKTTEKMQQEDENVEDARRTVAYSAERQEDYNKEIEDGESPTPEEQKEAATSENETDDGRDFSPSCCGSLFAPSSSVSSPALQQQQEQQKQQQEQQQQERASWVLKPRDTKDEYMTKIKKIFDHLTSGDAYEICLTTEFSGSIPAENADLFAFYTFLRKRNPTPFSVFFRYQPQNKCLEKRSTTGNEDNKNSSGISCKIQERTPVAVVASSDRAATTSNSFEPAAATTSTAASSAGAVAASSAAGAVAASSAAGAVAASSTAAAVAASSTAAAVAASSTAAGVAASSAAAVVAASSAAAVAASSAAAAEDTVTACPSFTICCASPELFLLLDKEGWLESRPIKGTRPRGRTAAADAALAQELATSEKDAAENMMVVDVTRSDLGRVSIPGTVQVRELMVVESYSRVHQLVSTIRSKLRPELSFFDAVAAAFPGSSMTGAPKKRAMKLLHELEQRERGHYSGAIGFLSVDGQAALNIAIRTLMFEDDDEDDSPNIPTKQQKTVRASFGTGGAIVAASDPEEEFEEMQLKADSVLSLLHEFLSSSPSLPDGGDTNCASSSATAAAAAAILTTAAVL